MMLSINIQFHVLSLLYYIEQYSIQPSLNPHCTYPKDLCKLKNMKSSVTWGKDMMET